MRLPAVDPLGHPHRLATEQRRPGGIFCFSDGDLYESLPGLQMKRDSLVTLPKYYH